MQSKMSIQLKEIINELIHSNQELEFFLELSRRVQKTLQSFSKYDLGFLNKKSVFCQKGSQEPILKNREKMAILIDDFRPIHLDDIIYKTQQLLDVQFKESNVIFNMNSMPVVNGDYFQLIKLFYNIFSNAFKFRSDKPLQIDSMAQRCDQFIEIIINDNGIGIEDVYKISIFELFRLINSKNIFENFQGGLATCKKIVETHGGEIFVRSNSNGGCEFVFTLVASDAETFN